MSAVDNHYVFISYSTKQTVMAERVYDFLEAQGVSCWMAPRSINKGESYATQIVHAIKGCSAFVLLASKSTNASGHISNEVRIAFDNKRQIIPVVIEEMEFSDEFVYFVGGKQWINAFYDIEEGLGELLDTLKESLPDERKPEPGGSKGEGEDNDAEPPDPPETVMGRKELIRKITEKACIYSDGDTERFEDELEFERLTDLANSLFSRTAVLKRHNKLAEHERTLDFLFRELSEGQSAAEDEEIIKIAGLPGTGKKVLMQVLFWKMLQAFQNGTSCYCPFYLALGYFEDAKYNGKDIAAQVKERMNRELGFYLEFFQKNPDVQPLLFVDDVRDHFFGKIELEKVLYEILKDHPVPHRVICVDTGVVKSPDRIKLVMPILPTNRVRASCQIRTVDIHDESEARAYIADVLAYSDISVPAEQVYDIMTRFGFQDADMYIVKAIAEEILTSPDDIVSMGALYHKWSLIPVFGEEEDLRAMADDITDYIFDEDYDMERIDFNNPQWTLIHTHTSFLSFLLAYHFVQLIDDYDGQQDYDCGLFNVSITAPIDQFAGDLIQEDQDIQDRLLRIVRDRFEAFTPAQKANAILWLAKIPRKNISTATASIHFLKELYADCYLRAKQTDTNTQENYDVQFLFRSICYTLIVYGQAKALDDYMCLLISNDSANEINRGALIDYYSDSCCMAANKVYTFDDNPLAGNDAVNALIWRIKNAYRYDLDTFPEIDLVSLCTLLQMRIQSSESRKPEDLSGWVSEALQLIRECKSRPQNTSSERIDYFFSSVSDDFGAYLGNPEGFDISQQMYNTLRNLRNIKRRQWTSHGIEDPESVAEHLYSAWMMAMIFLPKQLNEENYSKQEILDMLLVHDMAEAVLGDQVPSLSEPTESLEEHNEVMRSLLLKGSYPNIASLTYYYNIWTGYFRGSNINARIARDINIIQSVYTYREYSAFYPDKFNERDRRIWMSNKSRVETDIGYEIYEKLIESNADFKRILEIHTEEESGEPEGFAAEKPTKENPPQIKQDDWKILSARELRNAGLAVSDVKKLALGIKDAIVVSEKNTGSRDWMELFDELPGNWRMMVSSQNEPAGFWFFLALSAESFALARSGKLAEDRITAEYVDLTELPGTYHGYLLMDGILPQFRNATSVRALYNSLVDYLAECAAQDIFFDEICGVGVTAAGISLFKRMGFRQLCPNCVAGSVYCCNMKNLSDNEFFGGAPKLASEYSRHFGAD